MIERNVFPDKNKHQWSAKQGEKYIKKRNVSKATERSKTRENNRLDTN